MKTKTKKNNFSLIELLCVIVIVILLFSIAIPAFNTLTKGESVESGARIVGSQLKAARIHAVTNREYVALIIPTTESLLSDYLYKAYRPCIVNSSYVFQEWVPGEKWEFLPTGAAILDVDNNTGYDAGAFTSASEITGVDFSDIGGGALVDDVKGIVFSPSGKAVGSRKYVIIGSSALLEGGVTSTSNQVDITIDQYSGRVSYGSD